MVACRGNDSLHIYSASNAVRIKTIVTNGGLIFGGFSSDSQTIVADVPGRFIRVWDVAGDDDDTTFEDLSPWEPQLRSILPFAPGGQSLVIGTANTNLCKLAQYQNSIWVVKDLHLAMEVNGLYLIFPPAADCSQPGM
jgi:hypothetical protein